MNGNLISFSASIFHSFGFFLRVCEITSRSNRPRSPGLEQARSNEVDSLRENLDAGELVGSGISKAVENGILKGGKIQSFIIKVACAWRRKAQRKELEPEVSGKQFVQD